jgi:hypothetical protein
MLAICRRKSLNEKGRLGRPFSTKTVHGFRPAQSPGASAEGSGTATEPSPALKCAEKPTPRCRRRVNGSHINSDRMGI